MVSSAEEACNGGSDDNIDPSTVPLLAPEPGDGAIRIDISPSQAGQLHGSRGRIADFLTARFSGSWFLAPFSIFRRAVERREEASLSIPTTAGVPWRSRTRFLRKIDWVHLWRASKEWMKNPKNVAVLLWLVCVACFLSLLFLLLTELLDGAFPTTASRNHWVEICNQVLNALFTLMSLYQHPNLFHHLVLLCRWRPEDIVELRKVYCKNGAYRPHEWAHITVVVFLLNVACLAQYVLCGIYWGYRNRKRPEFAEDFFVILGIAAPVLAGAYTVYSPLGREYQSAGSDGESQRGVLEPRKGTRAGLKLGEQRVPVSRPEWSGGLFDVGDDVPVALLSFFCTCCVFGIQIRRRFRLPAGAFCCGDGSLTDYAQWMFCWACSLAQEVRTGNFYDVEEDSLYRKHRRGDDGGAEAGQPTSPPPSVDCDDGESPMMGSDSDSQLPTSQLAASLQSPGRIEEESGSSGNQLRALDGGPFSGTGDDDVMVAPAPVLIQIEDSDCGDGRGDRLNLPKVEDT
ncbi:hypothetical protein Taro_027369 [Colocasia esculenta]|uniref:Uncharacterized protein n=1 Tax=Colocasia esculenta TaxID=4460 RepID=A0A843VHW0_COLES|nr:hypothetical protein [Colocasia esculenta]